MHRIGIYALSKIGAYRSFGGLLRIGRAHQIAIFLNRIFAFQHLHHDRSGNHEIDQILEKRTRAMHRVKTLRRPSRDSLHHAGSDDLQASGFESRQYLADHILRALHRA